MKEVISGSLYLQHMLSSAQVDKIIYGFSILLSKSINGKKNPATRAFANILVIRMDEIGDVCYSSPVFELLKERYPDASITFWCRPFAVGLVQHNPFINQVVTDENLLLKKYDLIVDLRGKWKGLFYALKNRPDYRLERGAVRLKNKRKGKHPHEMITNLEVIQPLLKENHLTVEPKIYNSADDNLIAETFLATHAIKKFAVLHTGARRVLRQWPAERFATIAKLLKQEYGFDVVFTGDKNDIENVELIQKQIPFPTFSIAGVFSLSAFSALVSKANIYIGNESGPLHIALINNVTCIGLYGPGEPYVFYPLSKKGAVLHHILECNPCDQIHCVHPDNPCIKRITVEEVQEKISGLLR